MCVCVCVHKYIYRHNTCLLSTENETDRLVNVNPAERRPSPSATRGQVEEFQEYKASSKHPQIFTSHPSAKINRETHEK